MIKRKSARPNQAESGMATSPTEEANDRIAGWMRPDKPFTGSSPPRDTRGGVFGYNLQTGETVLPRGADGARPSSSRSHWDARQHGPNLAGRGENSLNRYHPDPGRPAVAGQRYGLPSPFSDSPYYPPPPGSASMDSSSRLAMLEDHIRRLTSTLNEERVDNARNHLHATSYMLQLLDWVGRPNGKSSFVSVNMCRTDR
jgi:hypothetical protein